MMVITMIVLLTGVTISRQDPGATQAQEASRCPSTLEKDISFSARSLVKLSFLPTAMDKACLINININIYINILLTSERRNEFRRHTGV